MRTPLAILSLATLGLCGAVFAAPVRADDPLLKDLGWRSIGPAIMGGRIDDLAVVEKDPRVIYVATAAGGIFKSTNNGTTWTALFQNEVTGSIGDIAIAPSNSEIVYVGTGEANNRQSSSWGNGVYKSEDGGKTWTHLGLENTHHIGRVLVHPTDLNTAYVAAGGHLWGANPERGVYKTTDGGKSWTKVLFISNDTGVSDIAMDPSNPDVLFAAAYQRRRSAFGFKGGGTESGLYKSTDAGKTWKKLAGGLPTGELGRIGIDISRSNPKIVYATVESDNKGGTQSQRGNGFLWRSDDGGETWEKRAEVNPRPMYFSQVRVDPNDAERVYVAGVSTYVSADGGKTFTSPWSGVHADGHALWIDPKDSNHLWFGCDGGIQTSYDRGASWDFVNTIVVSQFYEVHYDYRKPYHVYGGLQDNGTWEAPSFKLGSPGVTNDDWLNVGGGDGFYAQADPRNWQTIYTESQGGAMRRLNQETGASKSIRPRPQPGEPPYRFDWNTPLFLSPHNPNKLLVAGNRLFISYDNGNTYRRTEDLTTNPDRTKFPLMGDPVTAKTLSTNDGQDEFGHIVTVHESAKKEGVLWVGTDDGCLRVSQDDGKTWTLCTVPGVPKGTYVSRVHASAFAPGRCYVTFDGHRSDDFTSYVFVTEDFGATWKSLSTSLPTNCCAKVVREHPSAENLLFIGTERGAFVSFNRGQSWEKFEAPLPLVPVFDIQIHPRDNDLIFATHGRGIYVLDDLGPFVAKAQGPLGKVALAPPKPAIPWKLASRKAVTGAKIFTARNPSFQPTIKYYLGDSPGDGFKLQVLDRSGKVVRDLLTATTQPGWNTVNWDLRENTLSDGNNLGPTTPRVLPGVYTVKLTAFGETKTTPITVEDDPRVTLTDKQRKERYELQKKLGNLYLDLDDARKKLIDARAGLNLQPESPKKEARLKEINALIGKITTPFVRRPASSNAPTAGESAAPPAPTLPPALQARISRLSSALEELDEPVSPDNKAEVEALVREAKAVLGQARKINVK